MTTGENVLQMLIPNGGWAITGDTFEGITFVDCEPITEQEFIDGFAAYDTWKAAQVAAIDATRQALLDKLGITADEAKLLLS